MYPFLRKLFGLKNPDLRYTHICPLCFYFIALEDGEEVMCPDCNCERCATSVFEPLNQFFAQHSDEDLDRMIEAQNEKLKDKTLHPGFVFNIKDFTRQLKRLKKMRPGKL